MCPSQYRFQLLKPERAGLLVKVVERFIGTFQKECLDYHYEPMNVTELTELTDSWLDKYHFYRPA
jgi:hypothetical protein